MSSVAAVHYPSTLVDNVFGLLDSVDFRRADDEDEREAIFRLRHRAYLEEGAIEASPDNRFTDPYDETGNCWIFGLHLDGKLVSSIRLHVATSDFPEMPSLSVFKDQLQPELDAGKIIVDPTRHVVDREETQKHPHLVYLTMRLAWTAAEYFQSEIVLAAVRTEHQAFYKRIFGHRIVCPERCYPLLEKPISLMTLDYLANRDRVNARYPFFRSTYFERRMLFERLQNDNTKSARHGLAAPMIDDEAAASLQAKAV